jgi:hypothetical protein
MLRWAPLAMPLAVAAIAFDLVHMWRTLAIGLLCGLAAASVARGRS